MQLSHLEDRMRLIIDELKFLPSENLLNEIPYWKIVLENILSQGTLTDFYKQFDGYLQEEKVSFPSVDQLHTIAEIVQRKRMIIGDSPGARKTACAIIAKDAIEQLVEKQKIPTLVICPGYIIPHWMKEIREFHDTSQKIVVIDSENKNTAISAAKQEGVDYILVSYDMIFRSLDRDLDDEGYLEPEGRKICSELENILAHKKNYFILDEFHNAKNPVALRSKAIKTIAINSSYFALLSGTKMPNSIIDLAYIASLIDPERFYDDDKMNGVDRFISSVEKDPLFINRFLDQFEKKPRLTMKDVAPQIVQREINMLDHFLSESEWEIYLAIAGNKEFDTNEKYILLSYVLLDARKIDPTNPLNFVNAEGIKQKCLTHFDEQFIEKLQRVVSTRYELTRSLSEKILSEGGNALVYTHYSTGVTNALFEKLKDLGALVIDGDSGKVLCVKNCSFDGTKEDFLLTERDKQLLSFQTNPDVHIGITTFGKFREGRSATKANHLIAVELPWEPGKIDQADGRIYRSGQRKEIYRHRLRAVHTIDEGRQADIEEKRIAIELAEDGKILTKEQLELIKRNIRPEKASHTSSFLQRTSSQMISLMSGTMVDSGIDAVSAFLETGENALLYAIAYNFQWEFSHSKQSAILQASILSEIEKKEEVRLDTIVDLACGPAVFSRASKRNTICVDINKYQLQIGREEAQKLHLQNEYLVKPMHDTNLPPNAANAVVYSLGLHYAKCENGERNKVIQEINRILPLSGYLLLALPKAIVNPEGKEKLKEGLELMGFSVDGLLTGTYKASKAIEINGVKPVQKDAPDFEVHIFVAKKEREYDGSFIPPEYFMLSTDFYYSKPKEGKKNGVSLCCEEKTPEMCTAFYNVDTGFAIDVHSSEYSGQVRNSSLANKNIIFDEFSNEVSNGNYDGTQDKIPEEASDGSYEIHRNPITEGTYVNEAVEEGEVSDKYDAVNADESSELVKSSELTDVVQMADELWVTHTVHPINVDSVVESETNSEMRSPQTRNKLPIDEKIAIIAGADSSVKASIYSYLGSLMKR